MRQPPIRLLARIVLLLAAAAPAGATGLTDPLLQFRQTRTAHFIIYFHSGEEPVAARLRALVEPVRTDVGRALGVEPPLLTHVVLADQTEMANGWATPLPRNIVFLTAAVPSGADMIGKTVDWLRVVFTHEYTHVVHLGLSGGWSRVARALFGRSPLAFPNVWLPQWQIEGLATWEESALTGEGRWFAGDFRALQQVAAATGQPLTLDRASGGLVGWPGGHAAYAGGLGFHAYLAERFGDPSLGTLARRTARRLPFLSSPAFKTVYGESLGALWRDYTAQLTASAASTTTAPLGARRLTRQGYLVAGPRFAPPPCPSCDSEIVYASQTPHAFPSLRSVRADGSGDRQLASRYQGSTSGATAAVVVFDQQELQRNVAVFSDLYGFDRVRGEVYRLTRGARLQDPDVSPDGTRVIAVREHGGRRELITLALPESPGSAAAAEPAVLISEDETQFSTPRWSPDGRSIAVERRRRGVLPDVVVVDVATRAVIRVLALPHARIVTPAWRPDGGAIVAAADLDGRFELYDFPLEGPPLARRLTRSAGALWPDVAADGHTLVFAGYTADGFDLFVQAFDASDRETVAFRREPIASVEPPDTGEAHPNTGLDRTAQAVDGVRYSPLPTLPPTTWSPLVTTSRAGLRLGAVVAGSDVLGRHAYAVDAAWLADRTAVVREAARAVPDWGAAYAYTRWTPVLFAAVSRESGVRDLMADDRSLFTVAVARHETQGGVSWPVRRVRRSTILLASLVRTDNEYLLPEADRRVTLVSSRAALGLRTAKIFGYSVSPERGVAVGLTLDAARRALGSRANATTTTADLRAYLPGVGRHDVLALRAAAGLSRGAALARQAFTLGLLAASPSVTGFGGDGLGLMRDGQPRTTGSRVAVVNVEYRRPLLVLDRGIGTWPVFARTLHAAAFADVAQARDGGSSSERWRRAVGGELALGGVAGYALPFDAALGVSWGHDWRGWNGPVVFGRIGYAF